MTRVKTLVAVGAAIILSGPTGAFAQGGDELTPFVTIYGGAQPMRRTITAVDRFELFEEQATITSIQRIRNGAVIKGAAGYPILGNLAVGGGLSYFGRSGTAVLQAELPDPAFYDRYTTVQLDADQLKHTELGINISLFYRAPVSPKFDLLVSGGPSFIRVQQEIATVTLSSGTNVAVTKALETGTAFGVNGGVDGIYKFTPSVGLGIFVHYVGGKLDLPSAPGLNVGGPQAGLVVRFSL